MGTELVQFDTLQNMAIAVAKSGLWKDVNTQDKALALMLLCQAEGLHPMDAVRQYDMIQGKPTLKAEALLSKFYARGGAVIWKERSATACEGVFRHPKNCPDGVSIRWTLDDAKRAGLLSKDNWQKFPRQMLCARVTSEGVQVVDPGAGLGMLTPEEAIDVRNIEMDRSADAGASLTGEDRKEISAPVEITSDPKELKAMRAELNKALLAAKTPAEFRDAAKAFQVKYTLAVWTKETGHKAGETFESMAKDHQDRVVRDAPEMTPDGHAKWRESVGRATLDRFPFFQEQYNQTPELQTQENSDALSARGRELGVEEYADSDDNEIHNLSN
jgi:putative ubiquitin-RnfH superfamily antitoxin RatB of RatAB toxin-antitoxin module